MDRFGFALQWLDYLGNEIYNNNERILKYNGKPDYEISKLPCMIKVGQELGDEDDSNSYVTMSFAELEKLGFVVMAGTDFVWKPRQRCYYKIMRKRRDNIGITEKNFQNQYLKIQHDPKSRRIRMLGENTLADRSLPIHSGIGPWVVYDEDAPIIQQYKKDNGELTKEQYRSTLRQWIYGRESSQGGYQDIKEIPVMLSEEKYIVCIKKALTCQRIIVVGESGFGKSTLVNGMAGRIFYTWQDRVGWLIDPLNQFNDISMPQDYPPFINLNNLIGNVPKPIPAVQLYLACKNKIDMNHKDISLLVTLDYLEFLRKYKFYTYGIKDMDVGDTIRYLMDFIDNIKDATSSKEIRDIMFEKIPNAHKDKGMQAMIYKWINTFEVIFKEKFTSNVYLDNDKASHELEVKFQDGSRLKGHPFIMCYEAGVVPVFNISAARRQRWIRNYLADLMQKIVAHQIEMPDNKRHRVWIIADELNEIYEIGKKKDAAFASFEELYRQGRFNNIGFIGNTQSLDKLNPEMYKNATHICCVYIKDAKERKRVGDTYNLDKETYNKIEELKEQEMMIFSKEPFIIYDRWGRKKIATDRKWFKGRIFPPINLHKVPGGG